MDDKLATRILRIVAAVTRRSPDAVRADATFDEQGIDSLDRMNILFELEGEFDTNIPDEEVRKVQSIDQIIERMHAHFQLAEKKGA